MHRRINNLHATLFKLRAKLTIKNRITIWRVDIGCCKTFRKLTRLPWVTPELRELFAKAAEAAARRAK